MVRNVSYNKLWKGAITGAIGADGSVKTVQESNGTLKLDYTGSQVVVLKGN